MRFLWGVLCVTVTWPVGRSWRWRGPSPQTKVRATGDEYLHSTICLKNSTQSTSKSVPSTVVFILNLLNTCFQRHCEGKKWRAGTKKFRKDRNKWNIVSWSWELYHKCKPTGICTNRFHCLIIIMYYVHIICVFFKVIVFSQSSVGAFQSLYNCVEMFVILSQEWFAK